MSSLSKQIEEYIKALLEQESGGVLEIQRNILSEYFHCVPSQINDDIQDALTDAVGDMLTQKDSEGLTAYLYQQGIISQREMLLLNGILKDRVLTGMEKGQRDSVRASMVQHLLAMLNMMRHT